MKSTLIAQEAQTSESESDFVGLLQTDYKHPVPASKEDIEHLEKMITDLQGTVKYLQQELNHRTEWLRRELDRSRGGNRQVFCNVCGGLDPFCPHRNYMTTYP